MRITIGSKSKLFFLNLKIYNGEVEFLWAIEKEKKRWLWLCYSNAQHDKRIWKKVNGKYHFCLQIPKVIELDTAHVGKNLFGRINLTRLFNKDYHVYSSGNDVYEMGSG